MQRLISYVLGASTELLVASVFQTVAWLSTFSLASDVVGDPGESALSIVLRVVIIVLLVGVSFLLIRKDVDGRRK